MPEQAEIIEVCRRIQNSRLRLLVEHGFYGMLLMHTKMKLDSQIDTAATDGRSIFFNPEFLHSISDAELDFVMLHEVLHIALNHLKRSVDFQDQDIANIAADIVVNSHVFAECGNNPQAISIHGSESMHKLPDGSEGCLYSLEEVYQKLKKCSMSGASSKTQYSQTVGSSMRAGKRRMQGDNSSSVCSPYGFDDHSKWQDSKNDPHLEEEWSKYISDAAQAVEIQQAIMGCGSLPLLAQRFLKELREPKLDWKQLLNEFIQQEIKDYSFLPPDKRFQDSDFFLPDFNLPDEEADNLLFMIDTSGSMSDTAISEVFAEVKGAVDQFDGHLAGWLGFFDAAVVEPVRFEDADSLMQIAPSGGGGTSFHAIFQYIQEEMQDKLPVCIIILTDGHAPYPEESAALDIPVLWIINNEKETPPWGKVIRLPPQE